MYDGMVGHASLMDLPRELRDGIYEWFVTFYMAENWIRMPWSGPVKGSLLFVSKQVSEEYLLVSCRVGGARFDCRTVLKGPVWVFPEVLCRDLKRLCVSFFGFSEASEYSSAVVSFVKRFERVEEVQLKIGRFADEGSGDLVLKELLKTVEGMRNVTFFDVSIVFEGFPFRKSVAKEFSEDSWSVLLDGRYDVQFSYLCYFMLWTV